MELEQYNRSYDHIIETLDDEVDNKLRLMRQQCVREFIDRLNKREQEWNATFRQLLEQSREEDLIAAREESIKLQTTPISSNLSITSTTNTLISESLNKNQTSNNPHKDSNNAPIDLSKENLQPKNDNLTKPILAQQNEAAKSKQNQLPNKLEVESQVDDPLFTNSMPIKEFIKIQQMLDQNRQLFMEINTNPLLKPFKNEINLFIRTQINAISNSDTQHLDTKTRLLTNLFIGQGVSFQDKFVDAKKHPQGQLFSMDLAAQTFVTVGIRLVNSVPAIAKSMATVINGIVNNKLPLFLSFVIGHLQEQCPYLVPMHLNLEDFPKEVNQEVRYKIACGYSYDSKAQVLESDEKYLIRMRSMTLIYACILIQENVDLAWTWLASFLSLKPQPVISATILQAFLQEASKKLSSVYGRQYKKLLNFIKDDYIKLIEEVTPKANDRQSLIKLKNLLSDDSNIIEGPSVGSIFGAFIYS